MLLSERDLGNNTWKDPASAMDSSPAALSLAPSLTLCPWGSITWPQEEHTWHQVVTLRSRSRRPPCHGVAASKADSEAGLPLLCTCGRPGGRHTPGAASVTPLMCHVTCVRCHVTQDSHPVTHPATEVLEVPGSSLSSGVLGGEDQLVTSLAPEPSESHLLFSPQHLGMFMSWAKSLPQKSCPLE